MAYRLMMMQKYGGQIRSESFAQNCQAFGHCMLRSTKAIQLVLVCLYYLDLRSVWVLVVAFLEKKNMTKTY